jgi:hypothetical protein
VLQEKGVLENLKRCDSLFGVPTEHLLRQIFGCRRDVLPNCVELEWLLDGL